MHPIGVGGRPADMAEPWPSLGRRPLLAFGHGQHARPALYVGGFPEYEALLAKLGKHKSSKACLYLNKLADVDQGVLEEIVRRTYAATEGAGHCPVC